MIVVVVVIVVVIEARIIHYVPIIVFGIYATHCMPCS